MNKKCQVNFLVKGKFNRFEKPAISGNIRQLGEWKPELSLICQKDSTNERLWVGILPIYIDRGVSLEFKVMILNEKDEFLRWEKTTANRSFTVEFHHYELTLHLDKPTLDVLVAQKYISSLMEKADIFQKTMSAEHTAKKEDNQTANKTHKTNPKYSFPDNDKKPGMMNGGLMQTKNQIKLDISKDQAVGKSGEAVNRNTGRKASDEDMHHSSDQGVEGDLSIGANLGQQGPYLLDSKDPQVPNLLQFPGSFKSDLIKEEDMVNLGSPTADEPFDCVGRFFRNSNFIFVTAILPVSVTKQADGSYEVRDFYFSTNQKYYYLRKHMHKKQRFLWVGCMVYEEPDKEKERLREFLYEKDRFWPVFISKQEFNSAFHKISREYLEKIFSLSTLNITKQMMDTQFYDVEKDWVVFERVNKKMAQEIMNCRLLEEEKTRRNYVMINDLMCILIPQYFLQRQIRILCLFYFHSVFPDVNHFRKSQKFKRIFMSLFACDIVLFNSNQQAYSFIKSCEDVFLLDVLYEKGASIFVNYKGRRIMISIMSIGIERTLVAQTKNVDKKIDLTLELQKNLRGKIFIFSNEPLEYEVCLMKLGIFEHLVRKGFPDLASSVYFILCVTCILNAEQRKHLREKVHELNKQLEVQCGVTREYISLVVQKDVEKFRRITYLELADIYFEVAFQERVNLEILEYKMLRKELGKLMLDEQSNTVDALNHNVRRENPLKMEAFCSAFGSLIKDLLKVERTSIRTRRNRLASDNKLPLIDPETCPQYSQDLWFEYLIADLKQVELNQRNGSYHINARSCQDYEILAMHQDYMPVAFKQIYKDLIGKSGQLVIDFDGMFLNSPRVKSLLHYSFPQKSMYSSLVDTLNMVIKQQFSYFLEFVTTMIQHEKNIQIILFSLREKKFFDIFFAGLQLPQLFLICDCGTYYKRFSPGQDQYVSAFAGESPEWITNLKHILENYTMRHNIFSARYHRHFLEVSINKQEAGLAKGTSPFSSARHS